MDLIKEAFARIKEDILSLNNEISSLKQQISDLKQQISNQTIPTQNILNLPPNLSIPTQNSTHQHTLEPIKPLNLDISTGNSGVPTDKPTDRQTNQQTDKNLYFNDFSANNDFEKVSEMLNSLDSIKKEIRLKFKRLTPQEMSVFTELYSLEEQNIDEITYKIIAQNLKLSESSIRDYITKLVNKGIPILKIRQNNKKIVLKISSDLQKIATLSTILRLREL